MFLGRHSPSSSARNLDDNDDDDEKSFDFRGKKTACVRLIFDSHLDADKTRGMHRRTPSRRSIVSLVTITFAILSPVPPPPPASCTPRPDFLGAARKEGRKRFIRRTARNVKAQKDVVEGRTTETKGVAAENHLPDNRIIRLHCLRLANSK